MAKLKTKTKQGAAKRLKLTASGKIKRGKAYTSHLAQSKSTKQTRHARNDDLVSKSDYKRVRGLL